MARKHITGGGTCGCDPEIVSVVAAGTPCGGCGSTDETVWHRGYVDEGVPMPTCSACGGPEEITPDCADQAPLTPVGGRARETHAGNKDTAEHDAMLIAIRTYLPDGWDQIDPVPQYEGMLRGEALDYVDRLRARADRAEAALREIEQYALGEADDDIVRFVRAALSAGSGGRETTP